MGFQRLMSHLYAPAARPREAERAVLFLAPGLPPGGVEEKHRFHDGESIPQNRLVFRIIGVIFLR